MLDRVIANWPLKLLALGFAFAIWVFVTGETRVVQDFSVPLVVQAPDDRVLTSAPPTNVTVRVRGSESQIRRFDPMFMSLQVALSDADADPGDHEILLTRQQLGRIPRGVEIAFIEPDRVTLTVEERATAEVDVEPTFVGQPPDGFTFYGAVAVPDRIRISGPRSQIEQMTSVRTGSIRLDQRRAPAVVNVAAVSDRPHVSIDGDPSVTVRVEVDTSPVSRRLEGIPVRLEGQRFMTRVDPPSVVVELSGPPRLVERVSASQIRAVVDVAALEPTDQAVPVDVIARLVDVPVEDAPRISVISVNPARTRARVTPQRMVP